MSERQSKTDRETALLQRNAPTICPTTTIPARATINAETATIDNTSIAKTDILPMMLRCSSIMGSSNVE